MNDNPKYRVDARQSQIGVMGDHAHVDEIHFHGPSAPQSLHQIPEPTATFKGRKKELDELTEAIREVGVTISRDGRDRQDDAGAEAGPTVTMAIGGAVDRLGMTSVKKRNPL